MPLMRALEEAVTSHITTASNNQMPGMFFLNTTSLLSSSQPAATVSARLPKLEPQSNHALRGLPECLAPLQTISRA